MSQLETPPKKVLIVLLGAIGDVCRALPLATRIKQHWPETALYWAVEPKSAGLLEGHAALDRVIVFDRPRGLPAYREFIEELRAANCDLVIDLQRHLKSGVTSWLSRAPRRLGFNWKNTKEGNFLFNNLFIDQIEEFSPKILQYQRFGDRLGLPAVEKLNFGLKSTAAEQAKVREFIGENSKPKIAMILGSSWASRLWPISFYRELILRLQKERNAEIILVGGSLEKKMAEAIARDVPVLNAVAKFSLHELVALFESCTAAFGSDSGPMHIAAATGIPVVSLWGSTSPKRSAPYGSEHLILQSTISCAPCYLSRCPGLGTLCMRSLTPEPAFAKISTVF